ncbi:hypothetical protein FQN60_015374, partial [Etheostoma spectabile]
APEQGLEGLAEGEGEEANRAELQTLSHLLQDGRRLVLDIVSRLARLFGNLDNSKHNDVPSNENNSSNTAEQRVSPGPATRQVSQVEVVTFQDPRKKAKTKQVPAPDITPARLEVHRFGITGYRKEQQRVFEQDRAVMLGARPPKKDYVNYKMLQQQIKEKKQKAKDEVQPDLKKKKKKQSNQRWWSKPVFVSAATSTRDKKRKVSSGSGSGSGSALSGQVGRFKNGMLILSSKEIQKIKGNKRH